MIIRTVVSIKIQRQDNPYQIRDIIASALNGVSDVLHVPAANIYMKELSEPLIQFEVRYFINIQLSGSRSRVRSDVLYAIWEAFKQHAIHPPIAPQEMQVELVNLPEIGKEPIRC
jgi:potassium efflux system protein